MRDQAKLIGFGLLVIIVASCGKKAPSLIAQAHRVEVASPTPVSKTLRLPMSGLIKQTSSARAGLRNFTIFINLPKNVTPKISALEKLEIELPLLAGATRRSEVISISGQQIQLALNNEIHDLAGQIARVRVPVSAQSIFEVSVAAIFSPMGHQSYVFSVKGDKVSQIEVDVLNSTEDGKLLLASSELNSSSRIVTRGLDNLIDGDLIQIGGDNDRKQ